METVDQNTVRTYLEYYNLSVRGTLDDHVNRLENHIIKTTTADDITVCSNCRRKGDIKLPVCPFCGQAVSSIVGMASFTETDLDNVIERIRRAKANTVTSFWELGHALASSYDNIWKLRTNSEGQQLYRTWGQFCSAELDISPRHALRLMDIAQTFSKEDVEQYGVKRLGIMMRLTDQQRTEMLEEARAGLSHSKFAERVRDLSQGQTRKTLRSHGRHFPHTKPDPTLAELVAETGKELITEPEPRVSEPETKPAPKAEPQSEPQTEPQSEIKREPKAAPKAAPQAILETHRESAKPELRPESKPEPKVDKPEHHVETTSVVRPDHKPLPEPDVVFPVERVRVPLFARIPANKKHAVRRQATKLADDPVGEEVLPHGITQRFSLATDADGNIFLMIERNYSR